MYLYLDVIMLSIYKIFVPVVRWLFHVEIVQFMVCLMS